MVEFRKALALFSSALERSNVSVEVVLGVGVGSSKSPTTSGETLVLFPSALDGSMRGVLLVDGVLSRSGSVLSFDKTLAPSLSASVCRKLILFQAHVFPRGSEVPFEGELVLAAISDGLAWMLIREDVVESRYCFDLKWCLYL